MNIERKILGTTEFRVITIEKREVNGRIQENNCLPMMNTAFGWAYLVPVNPMYLLTLPDCKDLLYKQIETDERQGVKREYSIAEFI